MSQRQGKIRILTVDDEPDIGRLVAEALDKEGYDTRCAASGEEALELAKEESYQLVLLDVRLGGMDGVETLRRLHERDPQQLVIMLSAFGHVDTAVQCMRLGAYDYLTKPLNAYELRVTVANALRTRRLRSELEQLRHELDRDRGIDRLVGEDPAMRHLRDLVRRIAAHDISVLVTGASGTGKELVAESLHLLSQRKARPFVSVDCAALPEHLIESELFGYEKGAFTGAKERKLGRFELAAGGVLFLDEIGNLPLGVQVKLLRVLQERRFTRLGSTVELPVDLRLIAATNVDLLAAIKKGSFREDLFYRLNELHVHIPSLHERPGDVPMLANYFLHRFNLQFGRQVSRIHPSAMAALCAHRWTGNVRELQNALKRAIILADDEVELAHLPFEVSGIAPLNEAFLAGEGPSDEREIQPLKALAGTAVQQAEAEMIRRALHEARWNKLKAAKMLQIDYKTLFNKLHEYNIE